EARPAGAAVELVLGAEELGAAASADEAARLVVVPERSGEGRLGALLAQNAELLGRQLAAPLFLGLANAIVHGAGIVAPIAEDRGWQVPRRQPGRRGTPVPLSLERGELVADAPGDGERLTEVPDVLGMQADARAPPIFLVAQARAHAELQVVRGVGHDGVTARAGA